MGNTSKFKIGDYVLLSNPCVPAFFMMIGKIVSISKRGFYEVELLKDNPFETYCKTKTNPYMLAKEMTKLTEEEYLLEAL